MSRINKCDEAYLAPKSTGLLSSLAISVQQLQIGVYHLRLSKIRFRRRNVCLTSLPT